MQAVAAEMNLSETAFLLPERRRAYAPAVVHAGGRGGPVRPRHAGERPRALGDRRRRRPRRPIAFATRSGTLTRRARGATDRAWTSPPPRPSRPSAPPGLGRGARGSTPRWVGRSRFDWLVEVASRRGRGRAGPDMDAPRGACRGQRRDRHRRRRRRRRRRHLPLLRAGARASPRTRSPARRTAPWGRSGPARLGRDAARLPPGLGPRRDRARRGPRRPRRAGGQAVTVLEGRLAAEPAAP